MLRAVFSLLRALCRATVRGRRRGTLVVQPLQGIGDMVWHLPHIHSIAAATPEGRVDLLTKRRSNADKIFSADGSVGEILWLRRNPGRHDGWIGLLRLAAMIRRRRYAQAWLLHGSSRYAWALCLAGIPVTIGYGRGMQRLLLSETRFLPKAGRRGHPIALADRLLELRGVVRVEAEPVLHVSAAARAAIAARYGGLTQPWIALGIGSSELYKQWGWERFAELIEALAGRAPATFFALGGPADREFAQRIVNHTTAPRCGGVVNATGLPLDQAAALLAASRLFIGNDTGVLNMAAALGVDAIGLFGASTPLTHSRLIHVVRPQAGTITVCGMEAISVDAVVAEAQHRLCGVPAAAS